MDGLSALSDLISGDLMNQAKLSVLRKLHKQIKKLKLSSRLGLEGEEGSLLFKGRPQFFKIFLLSSQITGIILSCEMGL